MSAPGAPLSEDERAELNQLRLAVSSLTTSNENLVASIHTLSGELLKRRQPNALPSTANHEAVVLPKRSKLDLPYQHLDYRSPPSTPSIDDSIKNLDFGSNGNTSAAQPNLSDKGLPPEVVLQIFTFLDRVDIDNCRLVNHRWLNIIDKNTHLLRQRFIRMLKVVDNGNNMITISASSRTKCIKYNLNMEINNHIDADMIKRLANLLKGSLIKRTVICNLTLTELWVYDLYTIFNRANVKFARFEMIGVAIDQLTRDSFQNFIGEKVAAKVYFLDGIRNGDADFFNSRLLEKTNIVNAEDFTVYDVSSLAGEEVILDLGDEALLDFFFGRNITSKRRTTLYLDSPAVSQSFVYSALVRFVHETNYESMMQHAEFTHIREQIIHSHRAITNEYDTDIQSEWSSKNAKTDLVLEVKVTRASEDDELVHVTMDICNGRTMC